MHKKMFSHQKTTTCIYIFLSHKCSFKQRKKVDGGGGVGFHDIIPTFRIPNFSTRVRFPTIIKHDDEKGSLLPRFFVFDIMMKQSV